MLKIGLTGGIGSGKSAVANLFSDLGVTIIDADIIAHELTAPDSPLTKEIENYFGKNVVQNGKLNRSILRQIIFSDAKSRQWMEKLLHPAIIKKMLESAEKSKAPYCIFVIPLLFEGNFQHLVDRIVVVDAPIELQIQRTKARDQKSEAEVQAIIKAQCPREEKLAKANDIILNDGSLDQLKTAVALLHQKYLALSKTKK